MRIFHPAITSPVYQLVRTVELDTGLNEDGWTIRLELFQDMGRSDHFRCRTWELEFMRLTPTFPQGRNGKPIHVSDDVIVVERRFYQESFDYSDFVAADADEALRLVLADLCAGLEDVTGEGARLDPTVASGG